MKKLIVILLALAMIPAVQSCKKKQKEPEPSAKELITMGDWTYKKRKVYDSNNNLISSTNDNEKWVFSTSNDYYFYDNAGDIDEYGTWQLLDDDSKIRFIEHYGIYDETLEIIELTEDKFTIRNEISGSKFYFYLER